MAHVPTYPPYQQPIVSREGRVSTPWHRFFLSLVSAINRVDVVPPGGGVTPGTVSAVGYWTPITNGDPLSPEVLFDAAGDSVVGFVPTPEAA